MNNQEISKLASRMRYWSVRMTTAAGSGHLTSSLSATDLMAVLVANYLRYDCNDPENLHNDRVIFSKGHASPLYFALFEAIGELSADQLLDYRQIDSPLEGHPTPIFKHTLFATGSLGQGLAGAAGVAYGMKKYASEGRVWVLLGDGELAEGSIWEAASFISQHNLANLTAIVDVNRLGQSAPTAFEHHLDIYKDRFESFGWQVIEVDGHKITSIDQGIREALTQFRPVVILAKTIKGKGITFLEDQEGWHGKALSHEEMERAIRELGSLDLTSKINVKTVKKHLYPPISSKTPCKIEINYSPDDKKSVREAVGDVLSQLAVADSQIAVIDGDVANSTYTDKVRDARPDQFIECYIAEQLMVSVSTGLSKVGFRPVVATFGAFLTRAFDQIRMAAISHANLTLIGTHVGVSIGQDGPSQMALEDIAMMRAIHGSTIISPADAVSAATLIPQLIVLPGVKYCRATRNPSELLYTSKDQFKIGGCSLLKQSKNDSATIVATGVTVKEALEAYSILADQGIIIRVIDAYSIKPIDKENLRRAAFDTGQIITVEDHWYSGGLGDAVSEAFVDYSGVMPHISKMAVTKMPRSGKPEQLLRYEGISATNIVQKVIEAVGTNRKKT